MDFSWQADAFAHHVASGALTLEFAAGDRVKSVPIPIFDNGLLDVPFVPRTIELEYLEPLPASGVTSDLKYHLNL